MRFMTTQEYAIIVAGGKGTRINSATPKQFLELDGLPILMHTLQAFYRYSSSINIILVLPQTDVSFWNSLCGKFNFDIPYTLAAGGDTRFQSVRNGLRKIKGDGLVAIHDGVRPLVTTAMIAESFRLAAICQSAVAAVLLKESIRVTEKEKTIAVDRSKFRLIQTPQTFQVDMIRKAYEIEEDPTLTDDASVAERSDHVITLFEGSYENIKITTPEDLIVAQALLQARAKNTNG
jgi:2-C-methyl-D-erythritol 4-phosphate cytidylyltransferase